MSEHEELMQELNDIKRDITELKAILGDGGTQTKRFLKIKDIAGMYGTSYSHLLNHPILLPRCGESDYTPKMWTVDEVNEWLKKPQEEKKAIYRDWQVAKYKKIGEKVYGQHEEE